VEATQGSDRQAERRESTRRKILDAAVRVFAEKGYHEAAVDDIVRASSTSKGAVYFHFPNKQGVFLALVEYLSGQVIDRMELAIDAEKGGINRVDSALRTALQFFGSHRSLARILVVEVLGLGNSFHPRLLSLRVRFTELIKKHLDRAVADGSIPIQDTELAARVWLGALNELAVRWLYAESEESLEAQLPALSALLLRSIGYEQSALSDQLSAISCQPSAIGVRRKVCSGEEDAESGAGGVHDRSTYVGDGSNAAERDRLSRKADS